MSGVDVTLAITAHDETVVAGPSMESAERACLMAEAEGFTVERVIALDAPTPDCREFFRQPAFSNWTVEELAEADLGHARNEIVRRAQGRWIAFLDADDLFSENWLAEACRILAERGDDAGSAIVHPEMNWIFDQANSVFLKTADDDPLFTPYYFVVANYYDALCVAPRDVYLRFPFADRDLERGFAYEDWQWGIETMAGGCRHLVAPDTIVFKRRREGSQNVNAARRRVLFRPLESLAVGRLGSLSGVPRRPLEAPVEPE